MFRFFFTQMIDELPQNSTTKKASSTNVSGELEEKGNLFN